MKKFIEITNRLKFELNLSTDKEIAELLGLSKSAFAERKKRNSFPEKELLLLAGQEGLDAEYILTGYSEEHNKKMTEQMEFLHKFTTSIKRQTPPEESNMEIFPEPDDANFIIKLNSEELRLLRYFRQANIEYKNTILSVAKMADTVKKTLHSYESLLETEGRT